MHYCLGMEESHLFVAHVVKSFDTVDSVILQAVLSSLGLLAWFRHTFFVFLHMFG